MTDPADETRLREFFVFTSRAHYPSGVIIPAESTEQALELVEADTRHGLDPDEPMAFFAIPPDAIIASGNCTEQTLADMRQAGIATRRDGLAILAQRAGRAERISRPD